MILDIVWSGVIGAPTVCVCGGGGGGVQTPSAR